MKKEWQPAVKLKNIFAPDSPFSLASCLLSPRLSLQVGLKADLHRSFRLTPNH
jgi:hypothetical protein